MTPAMQRLLNPRNRTMQARALKWLRSEVAREQKRIQLLDDSIVGPRSTSGPRGDVTPVPDSNLRIHRVIGPTMKNGVAVTNAVQINAYASIAGSSRLRLRFKASVAGTLSSAFPWPDRTGGVYTALPFPNTPVVANTELVIDIATLYGEAWLLISFLPTATGTLTYAHLSQL